jgi:hypothetical protein
MSLATDIQAVSDFLDLVRLRAEQAKASLQNQDFDKMKVRIQAIEDAYKPIKKLLNIAQDKKAVADNAQATKDDLSK